jgi:hypothetical protein
MRSGSVLLKSSRFREEPVKKYKVALTADERRQPRDLIAAGTAAAAQKLAHARILLKADASPSGPAWTDDRIADAVEVSTDTVARVRQRFVEDSSEAALVRKKAARPPVPLKLGGRAEARLITLACSSRPDGRKRWAMQLLADQLVELAVVDAISNETVRQTLQKARSSRG